jgi:uncharacterized membrane protein YphA (DoxX/SURF4 family)
MKIIKIILSVLFGLMFINAGLDKFLHYMPIPPMDPEVVKVTESFMSITWLMPLVGFVELLAGLFFLFPKTRLLGALMIFPIMIGILLHNMVYMPFGLTIAGALFLINLWVLYDNRDLVRKLII